jgi:hypothetical protein
MRSQGGQRASHCRATSRLSCGNTEIIRWACVCFVEWRFTFVGNAVLVSFLCRSPRRWFSSNWKKRERNFRFEDWDNECIMYAHNLGLCKAEERVISQSVCAAWLLQCFHFSELQWRSSTVCETQILLEKQLVEPTCNTSSAVLCQFLLNYPVTSKYIIQNNNIK